MAHTPGPWHIYAKYNVMAGRRSVASAGGYSSSHNFDLVEAENVANARLIAASPIMLDALRLALPHVPLLSDEHTAVLAAIAQAEGE